MMSPKLLTILISSSIASFSAWVPASAFAALETPELQSTETTYTFTDFQAAQRRVALAAQSTNKTPFARKAQISLDAEKNLQAIKMIESGIIYLPLNTANNNASAIKMKFLTCLGGCDCGGAANCRIMGLFNLEKPAQ